MRTLLAVVLVALVLQNACDGLEYEVQEIGSAGHSGAELKESDDESAGGFFSALMTSGSMTMMQAGSFEEEAVENSLGEAATAPGNGGKPLPADEQMAMLKEENARLKETIAALLSSRSSDATVDTLAGTPSRVLLGKKVMKGADGKDLAKTNCDKALVERVRQKIIGHVNRNSGGGDVWNCDFRNHKTCQLRKHRTFRVVRRAEGTTFFNQLEAIMALSNTDCATIKRWDVHQFSSMKEPLVMDLNYLKTMDGVRHCSCEEEQLSSSSRALLGKKPRKKSPMCGKCKWRWSITKKCDVYHGSSRSNWAKFCNAKNKGVLCSKDGKKPDLMSDPGMGAGCVTF